MPIPTAYPVQGLIPMSQKIEGSLPPPAVRSTTQVGRTAPAAAGADRSEPVEATRAGDSLRLTGEATGLQALQRELSTAPAIDAQRVADVRQGVESGCYTLDPARIADGRLEMDRQVGWPPPRPCRPPTTPPWTASPPPWPTRAGRCWTPTSSC